MLTIIASTVSGTLIKGLISIWLKDEALISLSADVAIETLQKKTSGYLESRKIKRLLEQLEDEILEAISVFLEVEFRHMRTGDKLLLVQFTIGLVASTEFYQASFDENFDQKRLLDRYDNQIQDYTKSNLISDRGALVSKRMQRIDVFGIDSRGLTKQYDLSLAYVNLSLTCEEEHN